MTNISYIPLLVPAVSVSAFVIPIFFRVQAYLHRLNSFNFPRAEMYGNCRDEI